MKLTCYVVDDEPLAVELMEGYVRKTPFLELKGSFYSASANALDYLLKPISYADFLESASKALRWFEMAGSSVAPASIYVKTDYRLLRLELDDILYIEGLKDYVRIWLRDRSEPVLSLMSMKALEEQLPRERFVRVHRSYIIQPSAMSCIERGRVVYGKVRIPVSDTYRQGLQDFLEKNSIIL